MAKEKPLKVTINIPDDRHLKHITDAYGLVSRYRAVQNTPHEKMENWLLRLVVEGCNALFHYHNEQVSKYKDRQNQNEKEKDSREAGPEEASTAVPSSGDDSRSGESVTGGGEKV